MNTESCHCGLLSCKEVNTRDKDNKFTLQPLPYAENSLEPYISEKTVKFHYGKHLAAYIDNTNKLKAGTQFDDQPIHEIIKKASEFRQFRGFQGKIHPSRNGSLRIRLGMVGTGR